MVGRKHNRKGRNKTSGFVMLRHDVVDSPAYRSLSTAARCILVEVRRRYNGHNNGEISLSCREAAERIGVSKNTASTAFGELLDRGLLKVGVESGFNMKGGRRSRRWILTEEGILGQPPTNEWRKWTRG
jgi:hypothetical protein